jgi:4-amino-4-deoxy-L-arabinose transferase-like glycosyltransferase
LPATPSSRFESLRLYPLIFTVLILLHAPLLRLPYFWDEAGYYVPAAYDVYTHGQFIPTSTLSNAHPPLPAIYLALWWKLSAFKPAVTRIAMLLVAALALLGVYRLALRLANLPVAIATTLCTALYPVWFAQSSLAHADLSAAALTIWGLVFYFDRERGRGIAAATCFALACLCKETAVVTPIVLAGWDAVGVLRRREGLARLGAPALLLAGIAPLGAWYLYHWSRTGYLFGNPEFVRYNVGATLSITRFFAALLQRMWQVTGYMGMWALTVAAIYAMLGPPVADGGVERPRIRLDAQFVILRLLLVYLLLFSVIGGAVLARYLLPMYPLVILILVSTLWRRLRRWHLAVALVSLVFVLGWFYQPVQQHAPEDNLDYSDYVRLHKQAAGYLAQHQAHGVVLTAWTATDELTKPFLGYVSQPLRITRIEDFSAEQLATAAQSPETFNVALVFSTKNEPDRQLLLRWSWWRGLSEKYFGYHRDLRPETAALVLNGKIVWEGKRGRQWAAVIECPRAMLAKGTPVFLRNIHHGDTENQRKAKPDL